MEDQILTDLGRSSAGEARQGDDRGDGSPHRAAPLLTATRLARHFGGVAAVDGVSLSVGRGEILGLIGPNGAGKTTLFNMLAGDIAPSSGQIHLDGRSIEAEPAHRRIASGLARTFQIPRPFAGMTLVENVMLGRQHQTGEAIWPNWFLGAKVAREERQTCARAMELLDFVMLSHLANEPARVLSGGQRKLLELARALMANPIIMLLDEPAAGVNPSLLELIIERIGRLNADGMTFLIIEHNMDLVARLCRHVCVMASGRLIVEGKPEVVVRDPRVIEAYLGGALVDGVQIDGAPA
jgi:branched-chain amino acid transport system ATP-binding protein